MIEVKERQPPRRMPLAGLVINPLQAPWPPRPGAPCSYQGTRRHLRPAAGCVIGDVLGHAQPALLSPASYRSRPATDAAAYGQLPSTLTFVPTCYENSAAGGTNGTAVTTGNSGSASGNAWNGVTGTVTFDNGEILATGSSTLAYKLVGSASTAYVDWTVPNTAVPAVNGITTIAATTVTNGRASRGPCG